MIFVRLTLFDMEDIDSGLEDALRAALGESAFKIEINTDEVTTLRVRKEQVVALLTHLKTGIPRPFSMLFDLSAIDERSRAKAALNGSVPPDFTVIYHLLSFGRNRFIRIKVALHGEYPSIPSVCTLWKNANWYEREVFDMFGIRFEGHPHLRRILMPLTWSGHPLRKEHPARATEMGPFRLWEEKQDREQEALQFNPEEWGLKRHSEDADFMFLNLGPQHPGTHGVLRIILQLDGEDIVDAVPDIGFHHRGAEKMGVNDSPGTPTYPIPTGWITWVA